MLSHTGQSLGKWANGRSCMFCSSSFFFWGGGGTACSTFRCTEDCPIAILTLKALHCRGLLLLLRPLLFLLDLLPPGRPGRPVHRKVGPDSSSEVVRHIPTMDERPETKAILSERAGAGRSEAGGWLGLTKLGQPEALNS